MKLPTLVVLAGGLATRMRPVTEQIPKALIEVAGEPFVHHQLRLFHRQGFRQIIFCIGYLGSMIKESVGDGSQFGLNVRYIEDGPVLLGTGGAVQAALPLLTDPFFLTYGDSYLSIRVEDIMNSFEAQGMPALMSVFPNQDKFDSSNVVFENNKVKTYRKDKKIPQMKHIDYGMLVLTKGIFDHIRGDEPYDLSSILSELATQNRLAGCEVHRRFYEIGSPAGLVETQQFLQENPAPDLL